MKPKKCPLRDTKINKLIGERIKLRRSILKMSQQQLAEKMGLTFQQIQKYEKGINGAGAVRLWQLSQILHVPVTFLFADITTDMPALDDPMNRIETLNLVSNYYNINNRELAHHLFCLLEISSKSSVNTKTAE
jgi:transcriptional regulator with XRE-family HTH domain